MLIKIIILPWKRTIRRSWMQWWIYRIRVLHSYYLAFCYRCAEFNNITRCFGIFITIMDIRGLLGFAKAVIASMHGLVQFGWKKLFLLLRINLTCMHANHVYDQGCSWFKFIRKQGYFLKGKNSSRLQSSTLNKWKQWNRKYHQT